MPVNVNERYRSRSGEFGTTSYAEIKYVADGDDDIEVIRAAVEAIAPATYNNLPLDSIAPDEITENWWDVIARYREDSGGVTQPVGEARVRFDISSAPFHITQSKETVAQHGETVDVPDYGAIEFTTDFGGAIGVTEDGVEGADIDDAIFEWEEDHVIANASMTPAYVNTLYSRCKQVNADTFRGFEAGQVRLRAVRGAQRTDGDWPLTFRFAALPNAEDITIGELTVAEKNGWDYLWVAYRKRELTTAAGPKTLAEVPVQANVERVYDYANYADLNLPTPTQFT